MLRLVLAFLTAALITACSFTESSDNNDEIFSDTDPFELTITITPSVYEGEEVTVEIRSNKPLSDVEIYAGYYGSREMEIVDDLTGLIRFIANEVQQDSEKEFSIYAIYGDEEQSISQSYTVKNLFLVTKEANTTTSHVLSLQEHLLRMAFVSEFFLATEGMIDNINDKNCGNGGVYSLVFNDLDSNEQLSVNDQLELDFQDCFVSAYNDILHGKLALSILDKASNTLNIQVNYQELLVGYQRSEYSGALLIDLVSDGFEHMLSVEVEDDFEANINDKMLSLEQYQLSKTWSYNDATYQVAATGTFYEPEQNAQYTVESVTPWLGYLGEVPHKGVSTITGTRNDQITLSANFVVNSRDISVSGGEREFDIGWRNGSTSAVYSFSPYYDLWPNEFNSNNFQIVGILGGGENIETNGPIKYLFSRPITELTEHELYANSWHSYGDNNVSFSKSFEGAVLTITPDKPLLAGQEYNFYSGTNVVKNKDGIEGRMDYDWRFTVSDDIVPKISVSSGFYSDSLSPEFDGAESVLNNGESIAYQWIDANNAGITFTAPNEAVTDIVVPDGTVEDLVVHLKVSNEIGQEAIAEQVVFAQPESGTFVYIKGAENDYISQGYDRMLRSDINEFYFSQNTDQQQVIQLSTNNVPYWTFSFAAKEGETLQVGEYTDATRYPFQETDEPGISISGEHRGCNQNYGSFTIRELSYLDSGDIKSLAIDFAQHCESKESPALSGALRYNSQLPIEP